MLQLYNYPKDALDEITSDITEKMQLMKNFSRELVIYSNAALQNVVENNKDFINNE